MFGGWGGTFGNLFTLAGCSPLRTGLLLVYCWNDPWGTQGVSPWVCLPGVIPTEPLPAGAENVLAEWTNNLTQHKTTFYEGLDHPSTD